MKTFTWLLAVLTSCAAVAQDNIGFERGTFEGWTLSYGTVDENGFITLYRNEKMGTLNEGHKIFSRTDGNDPRVGIPMAAPGSRYSARIGNASTGSYFDKISTTFIATPEKSLFQYKFAVVLQDPGHLTFRQPAFSILVQIDGEKAPCGFYEVAAGRGIPGFITRGTLIYRDWTTGSIDLRQYIGKKITISIRAQDCTEGGHWGYAYFDAELLKSEIRTGVFCLEDSTIILQAPEGFAAYEWFNGQKTTQIKTKFDKRSGIFVKVKPFSSLDEDCEIRFDFNPTTDSQVVSYSVSACEGDVLKVSGQMLTATKNERTNVRIPRPGYCDSIVIVNLRVSPRAFYEQKLSACEGDVVIVGGHIYNKAGVYRDTLKRVNQCDSIITTVLSVTALTRYSAKRVICEEDVYALGDTLIRHSGVYTRRIRRVGLCDSIATVELVVRPLPRVQSTKSICLGDSFRVGTTFLSTAGVHVVRVSRPDKCDSVVTLTLTILDRITAEDIRKTHYTVTLGDSIWLEGKLNKQGVYTYTWEPKTSCINCPDILIKPTDDIKYTIIYNRGSTCESRIPVEVTVKPCPMYIPEIFTPNGDNINESFLIFCNCFRQIEKFIVYNRWGEAIYAIQSSVVGNVLWDGMYRNEIVPDGWYTYYIQVRYTNEKIESRRGAFYVRREK
ncbi:T9SS type B sorting domain-containing protein [Runella slithyformis]|uniref:Gliding motility-associated C-terminal domain-containing protein n=1 Tax=Runella slithyformis (strain ATCC 29530 / DSM 19594 / LMG 11500 / NCIMB 11436 / LSU 4) TaxID=761193 RepID=A0A7U3ZN11_RUNSL|nr:gliding motility-associated C-terminal domain-containing protein [Runella slithyformis]AEI50162.1 hypothetical protein Runsl_3804 [Runella slithyformis DSM 19594]